MQVLAEGLIGLVVLVSNSGLTVGGILTRQQAFHHCAGVPPSMSVPTDFGPFNESIIEASLSCGVRCNLEARCNRFFICLSSFPPYCHLDITNEEENFSGPFYCFEKVRSSRPTAIPNYSTNKQTFLHTENNAETYLGDFLLTTSVLNMNENGNTTTGASEFSAQVTSLPNTSRQTTTTQMDNFADNIASQYSTDSTSNIKTVLNTISITAKDQSTTKIDHQQSSELNGDSEGDGYTQTSGIREIPEVMESGGDSDTDEDTENDGNTESEEEDVDESATENDD